MVPLRALSWFVAVVTPRKKRLGTRLEAHRGSNGLRIRKIKKKKKKCGRAGCEWRLRVCVGWSGGWGGTCKNGAGGETLSCRGKLHHFLRNKVFSNVNIKNELYWIWSLALCLYLLILIFVFMINCVNKETLDWLNGILIASTFKNHQTCKNSRLDGRGNPDLAAEAVLRLL